MAGIQCSSHSGSQVSSDWSWSIILEQVVGLTLQLWLPREINTVEGLY